MEDMQSIEVGWPEISDIFGTTRYSSHINFTFTKYVDWIIEKFNLHVLGLDEDHFHDVVKTNDINNI